ncbi:MAG: SpoIIE family protein phosphatase [Spirochaetaceae bacterium]
MTGFVEVGSHQQSKTGQRIAGDTFVTRRCRHGERTIAVLSDGLGSGVKAGVLSTLTATMALNLVEREVPITRVAEAVMATLPVCRTRRISYSTFTIVDISHDGRTRVIEYDNPRYVWIRGGEIIVPRRQTIDVHRPEGRDAVLYYSEIEARPEDRILFFSDGVSQSGMGSNAYPLGWGEVGVRELVEKAVVADPELSAAALARRIVQEGLRRDAYVAKDDISSVVVYFRKPRRLLVATGPPLDPERDGELAERVSAFDGTKVIAGGTTANILARELGVTTTVVLDKLDPRVPPHATMEGIDLVTEGIITLARVAEILDSLGPGEQPGSPDGAAELMARALMESDRIEFLVGTRVNQAHQDPNVPEDLELRRTIVRRITAKLRTKFLKEVSISYV